MNIKHINVISKTLKSVSIMIYIIGLVLTLKEIELKPK